MSERSTSELCPAPKIKGDKTYDMICGGPWANCPACPVLNPALNLEHWALREVVRGPVQAVVRLTGVIKVVFGVLWKHTKMLFISD